MSNREERIGADDLIDDLLNCALLANERANEALCAHSARTMRRPLRTKSTATDMVTGADIISEEIILDTIRQVRPDDSFLSEESGAHSGTSNVEWIIDPLDGTTNFVYGRGHFGVSIAARVDGVTRIGVVSDVSTNEVFSGVIGRGAWRNGRPVAAAHVDELSQSLVGYDSSYNPVLRSAQLHVLRALIPNIRDIRRLGSPAIDLCHVADGRLDATYDLFAHPWDFAAGAAIAVAAGAIAVDFAGCPTFGSHECDDMTALSRGVIVNGFVVANPKLALMLCSKLKPPFEQLDLGPDLNWLLKSR